MLMGLLVGYAPLNSIWDYLAKPLILGHKFLCSVSQGDLFVSPERSFVVSNKNFPEVGPSVAGISCLATCDLNSLDFLCNFSVCAWNQSIPLCFFVLRMQKRVYIMRFFLKWHFMNLRLQLQLLYYICCALVRRVLLCLKSLVNESSPTLSSLPSLRSLTVIRFSVQRNLAKLNLLIEFNEKFEDC